jgi:hypothetical protein
MGDKLFMIYITHTLYREYMIIISAPLWGSSKCHS